MSNNKTGSCLCGAIEFEVALTDSKVHVCHCAWCRKWHGTPGMAAKFDEVKVKVKGEEKLKWYRSSEWFQRGFCAECGTHLFGKTDDESYSGVHVGALDDAENLEMDAHIFIDKKPDFYDFSDDSPRLTEEQFLQMIGAPQE